MVKPGNIYFDQATHDADIHAKPDLDKARALLREAGVDPAATTIEFVSWQDTYAQGVVQLVRKQIGRATCRERVCREVEISGVAVSFKKKTQYKEENVRQTKESYTIQIQTLQRK